MGSRMGRGESGSTSTNSMAHLSTSEAPGGPFAACIPAKARSTRLLSAAPAQLAGLFGVGGFGEAVGQVAGEGYVWRRTRTVGRVWRGAPVPYGCAGHCRRCG